MNAKNVIQTPMILQGLRIVDQELWNLGAKHSLRLLHKFKGRDMAMLLDLYDSDILDEEGEPHPLRKADSVFFERIVGILPVQIKFLTKEHLIRSLEVVVKKGLGSERLFRDHLLLKIERNIHKFNVDQYTRLVKSLADKQYIEDSVLWNEYIFKYIYENDKKQDKSLTEDQARKIWDAYIYLKLKCPSLDVREHIARVETFMPKEDAVAQTA